MNYWNEVSHHKSQSQTPAVHKCVQYVLDIHFMMIFLTDLKHV